jgi:FtsP/CotA-like multicopper oxidase with cupredoxin domain
MASLSMPTTSKYPHSRPKLCKVTDGVRSYPILLLENNGNTSYPYDPEWNVYNFGKNTSIRIVFYNYFHLVHPMHLHGHDFWVLAEGHGTWDGRVINPENPQRRDVAIMRPGSVDVPSYLVIEFMADNPGVWPLHCHIAVHVSEGLYVNIMERPDKLHNMEIPYVMAQTCRDWAKWSGTNYVNEIDSGL